MKMAMRKMMQQQHRQMYKPKLVKKSINWFMMLRPPPAASRAVLATSEAPSTAASTALIGLDSPVRIMSAATPAAP